MTGEPLDFVTILTTKGPLATKQIIYVPGTTPQIEPYGRAEWFDYSEVGVSNIGELACLLGIIEWRSRSFIIRGRPKKGIDYRRSRRLVRDRRENDGTVTPATIEPAERHWIALDFDSIPCPDSFDSIYEPDRTVEHAVSLLPPEFHDVTCVWLFTSSAAIKPGIRLRLFFWSDQHLGDWQLKQWLANSPVDHSIFSPAQPIYVARPIFSGMPDPVPMRSGLWRGGRDAIVPPDIDKPKPKPPALRQLREMERPALPSRGFSDRSGSGYDYHRSRIGDHEGGEGFHAPTKAAVAAYIARHGANVETGWLRADLEDAIRSAPRDPTQHDDAYVEFRVDDLNTLIPAIVELQAAAEGGAATACQPTYPPPLGSVDEARVMLAAACDQFVAASLAYHNQRGYLAAT